MSDSTIGGDAVGGPHDIGDLTQEEDLPEINLFAMSTIAASQAEHALKAMMSGYPNLVVPMDPETAKLAIGAKMSQLGGSIWDTYLEHLAEEKLRIKDYLNSAKFQNWLQLRSPVERSKIEDLMDVNTPGDTLAEKIQNHILSIWTNAIEGVFTSVRENKEANVGAVAFIVASLSILAGVIGAPMNIVDIASPGMVGANSMQAAVAANIAVIPPGLQLAVAFSINLFAMGLIDFSRAEALGGALKDGQPPVTKDIALIFAKNVLDKAKGNEVNSLLMAMLINATEKGVPITKELMNELIAKAKAIMIGIALAALYVVETGRMTLEEFRELIDGKIESRSNEETQLVSYMQMLRDSGVISKEDWDALIRGLGNYFGKLDSVDPLFNKGEVFKNIFATLKPDEQAG